MRRNRREDWNRRLVAENTINSSDLILPLFVHDADQEHTDIPSLPDVQRHSIDSLIDQAGKAKELGIPVVAVFPAIDHRLKMLRDLKPLILRTSFAGAVKALKAAHQILALCATWHSILFPIMGMTDCYRMAMSQTMKLLKFLQNRQWCRREPGVILLLHPT